MRTFDFTVNELFEELKGLNNYSKRLFIKRFEFGHLRFFPKKNFNLINLPSEKRKIINMYLSQMSSVSHEINTLLRYNAIRLYLIKSFRGRAQALGKPSRGQRTWSNASTAKQISSLLKIFINDIKKNYLKKKVPESKNKKIIKKKIKVSSYFKIKKEKIKNNLWF